MVVLCFRGSPHFLPKDPLGTGTLCIGFKCQLLGGLSPPAVLTSILSGLCPFHNLLNYVLQTLSLNIPPFPIIYISLRTHSYNLDKIKQKRNQEDGSMGYSAYCLSSVLLHKLGMAMSVCHSDTVGGRDNRMVQDPGEREPLSQRNKME